ncbi:MAG: hypothetical protein ACRC24_04615 [Vibrionaceae bacterium]
MTNELRDFLQPPSSGLSHVATLQVALPPLQQQSKVDDFSPPYQAMLLTSLAVAR